MRIMQVSADYWVISVPLMDPSFPGGEREVGTVTGDGPTAATRFKAITPEDAAINPDVAPGAYFRTLDEAAEWLAHGRAEGP